MLPSTEGIGNLADVTEGTGRFRPTRAGIINLWDYRDEEFVFADGRLVLRGPNGSGKTKALEVLFPFLLDGRIDARRLNPFAGEERTMKSNVLYRGQDSAYAYVWLEFAREDGTGADEAAVTVGIGMRAQKHVDGVTRWYFVTDGRVGVDFSLLSPDDRPLTRKQLAAEIGPDAIKDKPIEHRAAVDARLFGLGTQRYEQMLTLVLTLRRPQLAKHLDPKSLSATLADGLRPLDENLITEAAKSFDDMESVQRTLDGLIRAEDAATTFLASYTTYLRTHARAAVDSLTERITAVNAARAGLATALGDLADAETERVRAEQAVTDTERAGQTAKAKLDSLAKSDRYRDKEQLDKLTEIVGKLGAAARTARQQATAATNTANARADDLAKAERALADARHAVTRAAHDLAEAASDGGIAWKAADAEPGKGYHDRVTARATMREHDVTAVRDALTALTDAQRTRARCEQDLQSAEAETGKAQQTVDRMGQDVDASRERLESDLTTWHSRHAPAFGDLDVVGVRERLFEVVDTLGEPEGPALSSVLDDLTAGPVRAQERMLHQLRSEHDTTEGELGELREQRQRVADEQDDAPPVFAARTAERDARAGAPLWRLVDFAHDLPGDRRAALEAALHAANLLDAWVDPDDAASVEASAAALSEGFLMPLPTPLRPHGHTLADVLVVENNTDVPAERITAVLASVALREDASRPEPAGAPTVFLTGGYSQGVQMGAHAKPDPEYIGATARAHRRQARLDDLDRLISNTRESLNQVQVRIKAAEGLLIAVSDARQQLPRTGPLVTALRARDTALVELRLRRESEDTARSAYDEAVAEVGGRERQLTRVGAQHTIATTPEEIDAVADAIARFRSHGHRLDTARSTADSRADQVAEARERRDEADRTAAALDESASQAEVEHATQEAELTVLRDAVGADATAVVAEMQQLREDIDAADGALKKARKAFDHANTAAGEAKATVTGSLTSLTSAAEEAQRDAHRLAPYARRELLDLLHVPPGSVWPATEQEWPDPATLTADAHRRLADDPDAPVSALPSDVVDIHAAIGAATAELRPTESSLKSSKTRVSTAINNLQVQLSEAGHDYRPEWEAEDEVIVVRVADEQSFTPIGEFAARIAADRRDQEQLLSESEKRILQDALLSRLAQQIHERTIDARDLTWRMNAEMRKRRTSSGTTVGVSLVLADALDDEQRAVYRLTERDAARLGPEDLARMRAHFADRIKTARAANPNSSYAELLGQVLDYRRWRTFELRLVNPNGAEERLTQHRHATLSGGEQSVTLHLPLFAAAHATFSSADPYCPKLVALDEAFAGVDDPGRTELLGLTAQFDLDLFMTGFDLWATYHTVSGCAHYELKHSATEHAVSALLMVWDGDRTLVDTGADDLAAALGSPKARRRPRGEELTLSDVAAQDTLDLDGSTSEDTP